MRLYTVHVRRHARDADRDLVAVKEGFSWPAFFLSFLWALWHGLWVVAGLFLVVELALAGLVLLLGLDAVSQTAISLGTAVLLGGLANDLRRWTLQRRGFGEAAVVAAADADGALTRYLDAAPALAAELGA